MKKLMVLLAVLLAPVVSMAQQKSVSFGIKGGMNLSKFTTGEFVQTRLNANGSPRVSLDGRVLRDNISESLDTRTGWAYGIYARFGRNLYLQPELMVSTKNGAIRIERDIDGKPTTEIVGLQMTNFDVPILLGLKGGPLRVVAGPIVSFRISDDQRLREALRDYTTGTINDAFRRASYGYQLGGGLDLGRLGIDVRHEGSLTEVSAVRLGTDTDSKPFNQKLNSWQVTLAYRLF